MSAHRLVSYRFRLTASFAALTTGALLVVGVVVFFIFWVVLPIDFVSGVTPQLATVYGDQPQDAALVETEPIPVPASYISYDELLLVMLGVYGLVMVVVVVVTSAVAWAVAGRVIRPLSSIGEVARAAAQGDLDARVKLTGPHDEIRHLADSVDNMLDDLERAFESHQRFAANASHELRTPLTITQTMIDVTASDPDAGVDEYRALLTNLRSVNKRSIETVDALLDLADAQSITRNRVLVTVNPIVTELAEAAIAEGAAHGIAVEANIARDPLEVYGDATLLRQAVENLMTNALRHNHDGGRVQVDLVADGDDVVIEIRNTGETIDAHVVASLSEPFVRTAARVTAPGAGRGLGLALVTAIAQSHHGHLNLTPRDGGGVIATLRLPRRSDVTDRSV